MSDKDEHLTDHDLLLIEEGELTGRSAERAVRHLARCTVCQARQNELDSNLQEFRSEFAKDFGNASNDDVPGHQQAAEQLQARLVGSQKAASRQWWVRPFDFLLTGFRWSYAGMGRAVLILVVVAAFYFALQDPASEESDGPTISDLVPIAAPKPYLTPGAVIPVTLNDLCREDLPERTTSVSIRQKVFEEYGLRHARPEAYEVDYLITPELGGSDQIENLWPEPYTTTKWNAHVKDALEDKLHRLVCAGTIDLPTAQHDISVNWIAAYKKYFHTDRPLAILQGMQGTDL